MSRRPATARKSIPRPIFAPGARVLVRDEEWIVRSTASSATGGTAVRCTGLSELVQNKDAIFLTELDEVRELRPETTKLVQDRSPHYRQSRLYLESLLRQTPPTDEKLYIGHTAAMDVAPYQLSPAAKALAQPRPRILIADAVGLGKTVEVGVLLSELIRRGRGRRILVVALKSILAQFQEELWARFTIPLVRLDSVGIQRVQAKIPSNMNPFYYFDRAIISIDTLKKDEKYRRFLGDCHWDAIVIDECQHVAERARASSNQLSQRARLAKLLARTCDALIMTSATPHDGRPESFASLMNLLEPTAVADPTDYTADEVEGLFVRRFKKDVVHEVGQSFKERQVDAERLDASTAENAVFDALAEASFQTVQPRRRPGLPEGRKGVLFQTLLLKAFLSSPTALSSTVRASLGSKRLGEDRLEDPAVVHDREQLLRLQTLADAVTPKHFTKLQRLIDLLREIGVDERSERVVIFSERIGTLKFLAEQLGKALALKSEQIAIFHGTLDDQKQQALVKDFQSESSKLRVLLASDAAAEGINLHFFCHRMIHFDLPWSLITLEQRNGRIDRFGQTNPPEIRYLLTVPGNESLRGDLRVLDRLIEKEEAAHKNIGDAATLMKIYDAEEEEERVAEGIGHHEAPESIIPEEDAEDDFLAQFMGTPSSPQQSMFDDDDPTATLPTLFASELAYIREGYAQLEADDVSNSIEAPEWHEHLDGLTLQAPPDLQRRFDYLPPELQRGPSGKRDWEFKLTGERERVQQALTASRQDPDRWPEWQLLWPQHPIVQWLGDRVVATFRRHEAPVVRVPAGLGATEAGFLFQGILSNKRSQPVIVDWFAVVFTDDDASRIVPFEDLIEAAALSATMPNAAVEIATDALAARRETAVQAARDHTLRLRAERADLHRKPLKEQQRRVNRWKSKALAQVDARQARWTQKGRKLRADQERRLEAEREEIEARVASRQRWIQQGLATVDQPYLRIAAALVGVGFGREVD